MKRLVLGAMALLVAGCSMGAPSGSAAILCNSDAECPSGQLCFAEGCLDPGRGIVVEVRGDPQAGLYAHDVPIADGTLGKERNFDLGAPIQMTGEFQREKTGAVDPTNRTFYNDPVVLRAVGFSELIPGVSRAYEQRFDRPERGRYAMSTGEGLFRLTAWPDDPSVPPASVNNLSVNASSPPPDVTFAFPAVEGAVTISGELFSRYDTTQIPHVAIALTDVSLDVQAFDPDSREPLSQRFPVSSQGFFTITLGPRAKALPAVQFVVTPRTNAAPTPSKTFLVEAPFPNSVILEFGEYGPPVEVEGQALDSTGAPIAQAQVLIEGEAIGGGDFRSQVVLTDGEGRFTLQSLASPDGQSLSLVVIPPPASDGRVVQAAVTKIPVKVDGVSKTLDPAVVTCDDRMSVVGQVLTPAGEPAIAVGVRATEQVATTEPGAERPFPLDPVEVLTTVDGRFELKLDPATWRIEFVAAGLPLASRQVTVRPIVDANGERQMNVTLPPVTLSQGRTVTGLVTGTVSLKANAPVASSPVRFYRVTSIEGTPAAILLGSTVTNDEGRYTIVLPSR